MLERRTLLVGSFAVLVFVACSSDPESNTSTTNDAGTRGSEQAGQACSAPADCYPSVDGGRLKGEVQCLDRVSGGYCTHLCTTDADCCAVPGECKTGIKQVCAPFESTGQYMCFLSCEDADVQTGITANAPDGGYDGGATDAGTVADAYCQSYAAASASCRSTGGGKDNRKVCIP